MIVEWQGCYWISYLLFCVKLWIRLLLLQNYRLCYDGLTFQNVKLPLIDPNSGPDCQWWWKTNMMHTAGIFWVIWNNTTQREYELLCISKFSGKECNSLQKSQWNLRDNTLPVANGNEPKSTVLSPVKHHEVWGQDWNEKNIVVDVVKAGILKEIIITNNRVGLQSLYALEGADQGVRLWFDVAVGKRMTSWQRNGPSPSYTFIHEKKKDPISSILQPDDW